MFRPEDIANFPCTDLRTIDQLWVKYSQNRFGFSVQKRIWLNSEGYPNFNYETYCRFGASVGWYVKDSWLVYVQAGTDAKNDEIEVTIPTNGIWEFYQQ